MIKIMLNVKILSIISFILNEIHPKIALHLMRYDLSLLNYCQDVLFVISSAK